MGIQLTVLMIIILSMFGGAQIQKSSLHNEFIQTECASINPITNKFEIHSIYLEDDND